MNMNKWAGRKTGTRSILCRLAAAMLLLCMLACASAADAPVPDEDNPDVILAKDAAIRMQLKRPDGSPLDVRSDPSVAGRGKAAPDGGEPDYLGIVGFVSLPNDPELSKFSVFDKAYWTVPLYLKMYGRYYMGATITHKMPVMIISQELKKAKKGDYYEGYLGAIRLDTGKECMLDVSCFVTLPYWKLPIREIPAYGYCIAVYRETPGEAPKDEDGKSCSMRDGTRVLIPFEGAYPVNNPDPEHLKIQGIVFREDATGNIAPKAVYFREEDLLINY